MATMNVSIPAPMRDWVQSRVETGSYANASDYIRDLIRRDQQRQEKIQEFQGAISQGLLSGYSDQSREDLLEEARERAREAAIHSVKGG